MPAHVVTDALGLEPDEVLVLGSRSADPLRPASHSWKVKCDEPGLRVDAQLARLFERLDPITDRIVAFLDSTRDEFGDPGVSCKWFATSTTTRARRTTPTNERLPSTVRSGVSMASISCSGGASTLLCWASSCERGARWMSMSTGEWFARAECERPATAGISSRR